MSERLVWPYLVTGHGYPGMPVPPESVENPPPQGLVTARFRYDEIETQRWEQRRFRVPDERDSWIVYFAAAGLAWGEGESALLRDMVRHAGAARPQEGPTLFGMRTYLSIEVEPDRWVAVTDWVETPEADPEGSYLPGINFRAVIAARDRYLVDSDRV